jgi:Spy/CpxP family protein refolding chaperone
VGTAGRGRGMAGRGGGMGPQGPGVRPGAGPDELNGLDLTNDQRGTIEQLHRAARDQGAPFEDELQFTQKTLHRELFADKRDASKIANLQTKISALEKQLAELHIKTAIAVSDVLTAEQRETMRLRDGRLEGPGRR